MSVVEPSGSAASLIERAKNILLQPGAEWERIATERTPLMALLTGYVLPLAAVAAVCGFIGMSFIGVGAFGFGYKVPLMAGIAGLITQIVLSLAFVWLLGVIINALAPSFGSEKNETRANQLAAYSGTAGYVGGVATIIPALSILALVGGIYSLVLLYLGLPRLMKTPEDKRVGYFVSILVVGLIAGIIASVAVGSVRGALGAGPAFGGFGVAANRPPPADVQGKVTIPGGGTIDLGELSKAAEQMQAAQANPEAAAAAAAVTADQLRALLPDALPGGLARTEISTGAYGAMMGAAVATGIYENGDKRIELAVVDMGAMAGLAGMAGAFGVQGTRETADGYERVHTVDGRMTIEELSRSANTAKFGVIAAQRIMITADGRNVSPDDVRAAVNAVGVARAEAIAVGR